MMRKTSIQHAPAFQTLHDQAGLTLLEVLIAALILSFVMLSMITAYGLSRIQLEREEAKRKATAVAQDRLETVKARYISSPAQGWANLVQAKIDTTYTVELTTFTCTSAVADSPSAANSVRKIITLTVGWNAVRNNNTTVARSVQATETIARIVGPN